MLWRLPASLTHPAVRGYSTRAGPLRILFCGADHFSITSLRALTKAHHQVSGLIDSIDVVHRPAKPTGRGLKKLREVPIKHAASELGLPTHVIDTFTGWTPPVRPDLIVAVSLGLFVPPRLLGLAKYGGINVHPSLLPDLRGPAPIEHAILNRRSCTGVSVQTLHPTTFDQGTILAQTPAPGIEVTPDSTAHVLAERLAEVGAQMLVDVIKDNGFVPPHKDVGWYASSGGPVDHAPKITKQNHYVDFSEKTMDAILAMQSALGELWCILPNGDRLIIHKVAETQKPDALNHRPGIWVEHGLKDPLFRAACGRIGVILSSTYAGSKAGHGNAKLLRMLPIQEVSME
ncbi:formyl transferase [Paraphoma chrysanthemicola]|nr:formyl transferase [Paraphoma chrysanthemicola]